MLFRSCVALIDWKGAGVGDPGVDLGSLRMQMALQYGQDAPAQVLEGWQRQAGRAAIAVPYWDAVAALNTPTVMHGWPGFAGDGSPLDAAAVTERRDAFLRAALDQLPTPGTHSERVKRRLDHSNTAGHFQPAGLSRPIRDDSGVRLRFPRRYEEAGPADRRRF